MYARRAYIERDVHTASPEQLVVLLYRGLARFVARAAHALEEGDWARAGEANGRALDIVAHLSESVRPEHAPALADALQRMYAGWSSALVRALAHRDVKLMRQVLDQITGVCEAWQQAADTLGRGHGPATPHRVGGSP